MSKYMVSKQPKKHEPKPKNIYFIMLFILHIFVTDAAKILTQTHFHFIHHILVFFSIMDDITLAMIKLVYLSLSNLTALHSV